MVHGVIHSLKSTQCLGMLVKLDIVKGYGKLSWQYMDNVWEDFGFGLEWVKWVMTLVMTLFFNILLNRSPTKVFHPSRGIRQGDPMSPFLLILMEEGLGRLIQTQARNGELWWLKFHEVMES